MPKIHRFIDSFDFSKKELEIKGEIAHQINKVLKLKIEEKIELGDGKGVVAIGEIKEIKKNSVIVVLLHQDYLKQNNKKVTLFCSILKKENFETVVQKTTECGVSKIVPIISSRTVKTGLNLDRLKKIAKEASEQSGRGNVPEITEVITFEESLKLQKENDLNIIFDASGKLSFKTTCECDGTNTRNFSAEKYPCVLKDNFSLIHSKINIWIGPEGGWTEKEIEKAKNSNFKIISLGSLTLRAETASIIAVYLASNS
jgi:16S rRNA (uracil1498-N3)-methyltransferase